MTTFVTLQPDGHTLLTHTNVAASETPTDASTPSTGSTVADLLYGSASLCSIDISATFAAATVDLGVPNYLLIWNMPAAEVNNDSSAADPDGPATSLSANAETYALTVGWTFIMTFGNADGSSDVVTYVVDAADFVDESVATAAEVAAALQAAITAAGLSHTAADVAGDVELETSEVGPYASIAVTGTGAATLDFPAATGTVGTYTPPVLTIAISPLEGSKHIEFMRPVSLGRKFELGLRSGFSYAVTNGRDSDSAPSPATASVEFRFQARAAE